MAVPAASDGAAASLWAASLGGKEEGDGRRPGKGTCKAVWHEEIAVFEVLQPRGDSLKSMGSTWRGRAMLHAEEGVWLAERGMLTVYSPPTTPAERHTAAAPVAPVGLTPESIRAAITRNEAEGSSAASGKRDELGEAQPTAAEPKGVTLSSPLACARAAPHVPPSPPTVAAPLVAKLIPATRNPSGDNDSDYTGGGRGGGQGDDGGGGGGDRVAAVAASVNAELPSNPQSQFTTVVPNKQRPIADIAGPRCPDSGRVLAEARESNPTLLGGGPHDMPAETGVVQGYGVGGGSGEGRRRRAKRGRCGVTDDGGQLALSVGEMFEILARAGVPWECYRAYAELKRRSYVVRRRMEDTVGHDERVPRAAPLRWLARKRTLPRADWTAADNAANRGSITPTSIPAPATSSFPPPSSSSSSSSSHFSRFPSYRGNITLTPTPTPNPFSFPPSSSSSFPSVPSSSSPPHLPPVTFHVYNPTSVFRKRNPGPPDSVLAVCRFGDPMPAHGTLVALADHHARLRQEGAGGPPNPDSSSRNQVEGGRGIGCQEGGRGDGGSAGGGAEEAGAVKGQGVTAGFPMVKLAAVSAEAGVQLFDISSHDPSIAAGSDRAEVSDR